LAIWCATPTQYISGGAPCTADGAPCTTGLEIGAAVLHFVNCKWASMLVPRRRVRGSSGVIFTSSAPVHCACLSFLYTPCLGWADAPRCGEARLPRNSNACRDSHRSSPRCFGVFTNKNLVFVHALRSHRCLLRYSWRLAGSALRRQPLLLRIGFGVAGAPGTHRPTDWGVRIKGIKAQLLGKPAFRAPASGNRRARPRGRRECWLCFDPEHSASDRPGTQHKAGVIASEKCGPGSRLPPPPLSRRPCLSTACSRLLWTARPCSCAGLRGG
jgi:hypothetical protein